MCVSFILADCIELLSYPDFVLFVPIFLEHCRQLVQSEETALVSISRLKKLLIVRHFPPSNFTVLQKLSFGFNSPVYKTHTHTESWFNLYL